MAQENLNQELRVLLLEDTPSDAELILHELRKEGIVFVSKRVERREEFIRAIEEFHPDIILSDYKLTDFDGMAALQIVRRDHLDIPVIMVTGALADIEAVELIHAGAKDYVLKDRLARLAPAVRRTLSAEQGIRARKQAEKALIESENRFRRLAENAQDLIYRYEIMPKRGFSYISPAATAMTGYTPEEHYADPELWFKLLHPDDQPLLEAAYSGRTPPGQALILRWIRKDGTLIWTEQRNVWIFNEADGLAAIEGIARDITQRKLAELALQRTNRTLRTLSEGNSSLIRSTDEPQLLKTMCRAAVEKGGYRMAWVGYVEQDEARSIRPIAQAGFEEGYLEKARITWADTERGQGPTGRAVRSCHTQVAQNIASDPNMLPWRDEAAKRGYLSSIALPLLENGKSFGVLTMYATEADAFDANEIKLLEEMAGDLAFGIISLRVKKAHREHEQRLHQNMLQTVQAIAGIVEMRDPYTSGHQARVAELGRKIAHQMGQSEEEMQVIHLAGLVHDLGKISIPAEILSKPGRLSETEYSLIKMHPQLGYDILKGIDCSWPIAQMVLQHHERMDGSGYPQGLKGEAILLGARILSVADVVEAISSHRPYRPGLGIAAVLEEIINSRGTRYDAQVVDACVSLFRDQGYVLPS
jgi:PAS domain S-box-containing protein